jgi:hypothetical protein
MQQFRAGLKKFPCNDQHLSKWLWNAPDGDVSDEGDVGEPIIR